MVSYGKGRNKKGWGKDGEERKREVMGGKLTAHITTKISNPS